MSLGGTGKGQKKYVKGHLLALKDITDEINTPTNCLNTIPKNRNWELNLPKERDCILMAAK